MPYLIYDATTGIVSRAVLADDPAMALLQLGPGEAFIVAPEGATDATHFVNVLSGEAVLEERPPLQPPVIADIAAGDAVSVPDVPAGSEVVVDGMRHGLAEAGYLHLMFEAAGTYEVEVRPPWPTRALEFVVTVSE